MKYVLVIFSILLVQCCTGKKSVHTSGIKEDTSPSVIINDSIAVIPGRNPNSTAADTVPKKSSGQEGKGKIDLEYGKFHLTSVPECLRAYVKRIMDDEVKNPPQKIFSYRYNGNTVYYVTAPCCDFFTDLLNSDCQLIGHPDGGITGKGDGKITDFHKNRSAEKLVWEDPRLTR